MSSSNFPDGSRENPAIIPESDAAEFPDGSRENPAIIPESDSDDDEEAPLPNLVGLDSLIHAIEVMRNQGLLGFQNRNEEEENQREKRRIDEERQREERAKRLKEDVYKTAKNFALELHSDLNPKILQKQSKKEEEEVVVKGDVKGKSQFKEAKEAIEKRKSDSISSSNTTSGEIGFNLLTQRKAPSLMEMCAKVLAKNSESIKSLNLVPDHLRKKLSNLVSNLSKVDARFMQLLIQDSPYEVFSTNCVDLEEKDLIKILCDCDRVSLKMLSLDLCGRAMTENAITEFLKRSPYGFPALTTLSLKGAFCLTDSALALISRSAPLLRFINLSECSFLTFHAVKILADNFGSTLRGLNIGGCQGIKPSNVFKSSLSKFANLNYLSVAGLESIHDILVEFFTSRGSNLSDLSLASCNEVTDRTIWTIGRYCPKLEALDISDLDNLTDDSLEYITDGCRFLNSVKLTKNRFSDEAVAAFLEVCGGSLNQLCLNNVRDVGQDTAISLAKNCKRLRHLDLSWCRKLTEGELRLILSSCSLLRSLKLFGWTQVKDEFLEELSRSLICITGLKKTSVFANLDNSFPSVDAKFF